VVVGRVILSKVRSPMVMVLRVPVRGTIGLQNSRSGDTECSPASGLARVNRMANPLTLIRDTR
jgi:hypothetical protein